MANIMSFSIGYADASLTSLKSKNSVNGATTYTIPNNGIQKRRWWSRLFLLGIVFSMVALSACKDAVGVPEEQINTPKNSAIDIVLPVRDYSVDIIGQYHNIAMNQLIYNSSYDFHFIVSHPVLPNDVKALHIMQRVNDIMYSTWNIETSPELWEKQYNFTMECLGYNYINDYTSDNIWISTSMDLTAPINCGYNSIIEDDFVIQEAYFDMFINVDMDSFTDVGQVFDHISNTATNYLNNINNYFPNSTEGHAAVAFLSTAKHSAMFWDSTFALSGFVDSLALIWQNTDAPKVSGAKSKEQFQVIPLVAIAIAAAKTLVANDARGAVAGAASYLVECALWGKEVTSEGIIHAASTGAVYGTGLPVLCKGVAAIANKLRKYL